MSFQEGCDEMVTQSSGSYNVSAYEAAEEKKQSTINVSVVQLDQSEVVFKVNKRDKGKILLDLVFDKAKLVEFKYFGLQFPLSVPDSMRWLDPTKTIRKQFKRGYPHILFLRIKFYVPSLFMIKNSLTKYKLFLQLKLDMLERKLAVTPSMAVLLSALIVQHDLGDYDEVKHRKNYISNFKLVPNQTKEFEHNVLLKHKTLSGVTRDIAITQFISSAQTVSTYGVEIHSGFDSKECKLDIGVDSKGITIMQKSQLKKDLKWAVILKISFKRRQFFIQLKALADRSESSSLITTFYMDNYRACKRLWKSCVDFHSFYRQVRNALDSVKKQNLLLNKSNDLKSKAKLPFISSSKKQVRKSRSNENLTSVCEQNLKQNKLKQEIKSRRLSAPPSVEIETPNITRKLELKDGINKVSKMSLESNDSLYSSTERIPTPTMHPYTVQTIQPQTLTLTSCYPVTAKELHSSTKSEKSKLKTSSLENVAMNSSENKKLDQVSTKNMKSNGLHQNISFVKLVPDSDGRYGFHVKGGIDHNMDIVISKIAPNSQASKCSPPIEVGDKVLQVNGRDVFNHTHDQVVRFIQSTRESHTGHLQLLLKKSDQQVVNNIEILEEPVYTNLDPKVVLSNSINYLKDRLCSGELIDSFESLYRKKPDGTFNDAKLNQNLHKNRYRDISPYDDTRVHLNDKDEDYINGNYVNMAIPGKHSTINYYIACQGPLKSTAKDFWTMVWEQKSTFIVMLTSLVERGRNKCFQYWPNLNSTTQFGDWVIKCESEEIKDSFAFRDFVLYKQDKKTSDTKSRKIKHMQYIAWPDHGVPNDSSDFLDFVVKVRQNRVGMDSPSIIHCSAGIGRTGVLITMETAMCLIDQRQAVMPIQIVKSMRDQRAMMIQTSSQFKFVCEAILKVYEEPIPFSINPTNLIEDVCENLSEK